MLEVNTMTKRDLEYAYKKLAGEINDLQAKKDNLEKSSVILKSEIAQINNQLEKLSKNLLVVIEEIRKSV
jgi:predicted  nucleic acid-binding Zn-ribbon protein